PPVQYPNSFVSALLWTAILAAEKPGDLLASCSSYASICRFVMIRCNTRFPFQCDRKPRLTSQHSRMRQCDFALHRNRLCHDTRPSCSSLTRQPPSNKPTHKKMLHCLHLLYCAMHSLYLLKRCSCLYDAVLHLRNKNDCRL